MEDRRARFEQIYRQHAGAVAAYALRRAPRETAEEVVAETFLVAWRRLDGVPEQSLPWLYGVARRMLANQRRSTARRAALTQRLKLQAAVAALDSVDECLVDALQALQTHDREVLMLVAWEGLTSTEAAQALGCSPVACRIRLHRARKRLARAMDSPPNSAADLATTEAK